MLPNVTDADVINAFTCSMTSEALAHEAPCTRLELLDVATKYATVEEAVQANFNSKAKAAAT
jgi:hypothetical protein